MNQYSNQPLNQSLNQSLSQSAGPLRSVENLVEFITGFQRELGTLAAFYGQLPALIAAEHEAITSGNFNLVRDASEAKMMVCDQIATSHESLVGLSKRLPRMAELMTGHSTTIPVTLSECLTQLVDLADSVSGGSGTGSIQALTRDILQRLLSSSTSSLEAFLEIAETVKPRIEGNRILLQKLSQSYQDSYRFWLEMAAGTQAPYDARGMQRSSSVASGIRIKA